MEEEISSFEEEIINSMKQELKNSVELPKYEKILLFLHSLFLVTGRVDIMFCNSFLNEATQLLKNSIFLYTDGLFDCAFYSVRQASEVINSMLYLAQNPSKRKEWASKERFPMDSKIRNQLEKFSENYKELKSLIPEYFSHQEELIKLSHKIIHKQGLDTFYRARKPYANSYGFNQENEVKLFVDVLKYTIGLLLIIFVLIDPMCLVLSDENVTYKINMSLMTEPINMNYFQEFLGLDDIIDKIRSSHFYQNIISSFSDYEEMNIATYNVVREEFWDIESLDEIEKQLHLISPIEKIMFQILKEGIKVSNFYVCGGLGWYLTSIKCNRRGFSFNSEVFKNYAATKIRFNQIRENVFISVLNIHDNDVLYLEHNDMLTGNEVKILLSIENQYLCKEENHYAF